MSHESLEGWIARLNDGDDEAFDHIIMIYEPYLRIVIRRRLSSNLRAKVDSGDIMQSVFADLLRGVRDGGCRFDGRSQLLAFLRKIACRRLADRYQKHGTALDRERSLGEIPIKSLPIATQPRPSQEAQGQELWESILRACPPAHHEIIRLRRDGHRIGEIASRTGLHSGSVRRILYDLARRLSIVRRAVLPDPRT